MIWFTLLKRFWPILAVASLVAGLGVWHFSQTRAAYRAGYEARTAEMLQRVQKARAENERIRIDAERAYAARDRALVDRVLNIDVRPIRLCVPAPRLREADATPSIDAAPVESRPTLQASDDIARPLVRYGSDCERTRQQLEALQSWVRSINSPRAP